MPSNRIFQYVVRNESYKDMKEKRDKILTLQRCDEKIVEPQSWIPIKINTIKNFISFENNNYRVEGFFFKQDGKVNGDRIMINNKVFTISDNYIYSKYIIDNYLNLHYFGKDKITNSRESALSRNSASNIYIQEGKAPCTDSSKIDMNYEYLELYLEEI